MLVVGVRGELLLDGIARAARAEARERVAGLLDDLFGREVARVRAAALDHEAGNVAVELQAVVEAF